MNDSCDVAIVGSGFADRAAPRGRAAYNAWLQQRMRRTGGCNSWYLDEEGVNRTLYPGPSSEFWRSLRHVDEGEHLLEPVRRSVPERVQVTA